MRACTARCRPPRHWCHTTSASSMRRNRGSTSGLYHIIGDNSRGKEYMVERNLIKALYRLVWSNTDQGLSFYSEKADKVPKNQNWLFGDSQPKVTIMA